MPIRIPIVPRDPCRKRTFVVIERPRAFRIKTIDEAVFVVIDPVRTRRRANYGTSDAGEGRGPTLATLSGTASDIITINTGTAARIPARSAPTSGRSFEPPVPPPEFLSLSLEQAQPRPATTAKKTKATGIVLFMGLLHEPCQRFRQTECRLEGRHTTVSPYNDIRQVEAMKTY